MTARDEQIEHEVTADSAAATAGRTTSTTTSRTSKYHGHNLNDFNVKYGRKAEENHTSGCDSFLTRIRGVSCTREQVLNFVKRRIPAVNLIRTYKV